MTGRGQDPVALLREVWFRTADRLVIEGAAPWELDEALEAAGLAMGPFEMMDGIGLDTAWAGRDHALAAAAPERRHLLVSRRMLGDGRLGRKVGVGWYRYPGGGGKVIDPLVEDNIAEEAWFARLPRREIGDVEVRLQMRLALLCAAAGLVGEGRTPQDVDALCREAVKAPQGFVPALAGMDAAAVQEVRADLAGFCARTPEVWEPLLALWDGWRATQEGCTARPFD